MNAETSLKTANEKAGKPAFSFVFLSKTGLGDRLFQGLATFFALGILFLAVGMILQLWRASGECMRSMGWSFLTSQNWDPVREIFGSVPYVYGTVVSSLIAFAIAAPFGIGIALFLSEMAPLAVRGPISFLVDTLAAIPSVVYGLWGMFVLAPLMRSHVDPWLIQGLGSPFFKLPDTGLSLFTAGVIVSIMILPTIMAISREVFSSVPVPLRESALALGSTKWEAIVTAVLGPSRAGIVGAVILGLGRALGETMAVTMVIGNKPEVSLNLLAPSHSMASVIANEFSEAVSGAHLSALAEMGLLLFAITITLNVLARLLVWGTARKFE